jgi:peptidoglycan/LPS O-acetylase OafA/YrhL
VAGGDRRGGRGLGVSRERLPFIDWLKAIGISLVVYGHLVGWTINDYFPPIFPKQLGVALFVFVAGYSLASETRSGVQVLARRLFDLVFIGVIFAVVLSIIGLATDGGLRLSNFMPFAFGSNVLRDNFPANPTTWYIGMYIHLMVLWAVLVRRLDVTAGLLIAALVLEITIRAVVWKYGGGFQSYQLVTNWLGCFLLGRAAGQAAMHGPGARSKIAWLGWTLVVLGAAWLVVQPFTGVPLDLHGPFRPVTGGTSDAMRAVLSMAVSLVYLGTCWAAYHVTRSWPRSAVAEFLSRYTIFIFIAHMPVMYAVDPSLAPYPMWLQSLVRVAICFGLVTAGAVVFHQLVDVAAIRQRVLTRWAPTGR